MEHRTVVQTIGKLETRIQNLEDNGEMFNKVDNLKLKNSHQNRIN